MASLNKTDLATHLAEATELSAGEAKLAIEKTMEILAQRLAAGDEVSLAGFGKFSTAARPAREGRNPANGQTIQIAASTAVKFTAAKALKDTVNA